MVSEFSLSQADIDKDMISEEGRKIFSPDQVAAAEKRLGLPSQQEAQRLVDTAVQNRFGGAAPTGIPDAGTVSGRVQLGLGNVAGNDPKVTELVQGSQFGEAVLGREGLGRIRDANIVDIENRFQGLSKGFSEGEFQAKKERSLQGIDQGTQAQSRALQAALSRAGVRGGAAGEQLKGVALGGLQQKRELETTLLLEDRAARAAALGEEAKFTQGIKEFDLAQAAKEKSVALQTGLGFAQLGAAERGAKIAADAIKNAPSSGGGGGGLTVVCTELNRQGILSNEVWEKNKEFGRQLYRKSPETFNGYLVWGTPLAKLMRNSKVATFLIAPIIKKAGLYMAGEKTWSNRLVFTACMTLNITLGKLLFRRQVKAGEA